LYTLKKEEGEGTKEKKREKNQGKGVLRSVKGTRKHNLHWLGRFSRAKRGKEKGKKKKGQRGLRGPGEGA